MSEVALAEPEVIQAEAPTQEQTPIDPGNAAESTSADAGADTTTSTEAAPLSVEAYVEAQLHKEGEQAKPEPAREPQVDPEVLRQADEARARYQGTAKAGHDSIDAEHEAAVARLMEEGYTKTIAETLVAPLTKASHDRFNELYATGLKDAGYMSAYEQNRALWLGVEAGVPKEHHETIAQKLSEGKYGSYKDVAADLYGLGMSAGETKGYEAGRKAGLTQGYQDGLAQAGKVASLSSDGQQVNGTGWIPPQNLTRAAAQNLKPEQVAEMMATPEGYARLEKALQG